MWPLILAGARAYAPYIVFPFAVTVGAVGYIFETRFRNAEKWQKTTESTLEQRSDRQLDKLLDATEVGKLQYRDVMPETMFDKNQGYKRGFTGRSIHAEETSKDS
ncbi:predicted protein [Nematostella vectensis]|uniref:Small integral membrane protein 12 n=1 Tax=Nematostella vectensis TaxID=45351 RepID=A7RZM5_NEMVE|nr:predicted protein [Nematostella vectensis]|eukprot:XP_001635187.1 predicted protein [Nematostella vectensis]